MTSPRALFLATVGALCLAGSATPGSAQTIPSPYRFVENGKSAGMFVGYVDAGRGRFELGPKGGFAGGVRWTLRASNSIGIETSAMALPTQRDVIDPTLPAANRSIGEVDSNLVFIDARIRLNLTGQRTWNRIQPFVTVGGGLGFDVAGNQALDGDLPEAIRYDFGVKFSGVFGAGARIFLADHLAIRAETDLLLYQIETPDGWIGNPELDVEGILESEWASSPFFKIGLSFLY